MKYSKPVIASNTGANLENIDHGVTGILHEYGSPNDLANWITEIVENPSWSASIVKNAYQFAYSRFNLENHGKQFKKILTNLK